MAHLLDRYERSLLPLVLGSMQAVRGGFAVAVTPRSLRGLAFARACRGVPVVSAPVGIGPSRLGDPVWIHVRSLL